MTAQPDPPLFFSFSTLGCPAASWDEAAELARSWNMGLELRALSGKLELTEVLGNRFGAPPAMAEACRSSGVRIASLDSSLHLIGAREEQYLELLALAAWADALGVPYLRVFDGGTAGQNVNEGCQEIGCGLEKWSAIRKSEGLRCELMVETHGLLMDTDTCLALAEKEGNRLNLLWDTTHTWKFRPGSLAEEWKRLKPWVRHLHIKDVAKKDSDFHYVKPGTGEVPLKPLLAALRADGFQGPVSLEWEKLWHPELPSLEEALLSGRETGWWP